ncbi:MAG TPA: hypothetical protein VFE58_00370 [Tepidisphaeraceae bacterium]|jgi:hypothetical protein|nr:hypothetical protein [Tepidisphaeraceae bacterium]
MVWGAWTYLPVIGAAGIACAGIAVTAYQKQLRGSGWLWRWSVPALRVMALLAILGSGLRPSVWRPVPAGEQGGIVVMWDDSASMSVTDSSWTPAELVPLADGLGELPTGQLRWPGGEWNRELKDLLPVIDEAARAASELEYARVAGRSVEAAQARALRAREALVAACRKLSLRARSLPGKIRETVVAWSAEVGKEIDAKGRSVWGELRSDVDAAMKLTDEHQKQTDAALYAANARVREVCDGLGRLSRIELAQLATEKSLRSKIPADVPVRIVTVSDPGKVVAGEVQAESILPDIESAVQNVSRGHGRANAPRSVVLFTDQPEGELQAGVPVVVCRCVPEVVRDVAVRQVVMPAVAYVGDEVMLHVELAEVGFSGAVVNVKAEHDGIVQMREMKMEGDHGVAVDLPLRFMQAGMATVKLSVTPFAGEATVLNNIVERSIRILSERTAVAVIAAQDDSGALGTVLPHLPGIAVAEIAKAQVVILKDASATTMSAEQLDAVRAVVADRGGGVVLVAGREHWPLDAESEALLDDYLPYHLINEPEWREEPGQVAAKGIEGLALAGVSRHVDRYLDLGDLRQGVRTLMTEPASGAPIVTESQAGNGRVLMVAMDDLPRTGDPLEAEQFWQAVIHEAAGPTYAIERGGYGLDTDAVDVGAGQVVNVRVKIPLGRGTEGGSQAPSLLVMKGTRVAQSEPMTALGAGRFSASLRDLPSGEDVVRLDPGVGDALAPIIELPLRVRSGLEEELASVASGTTNESGSLPISEVGRLASEALRARGDQPAVIEYALWDSPYLFVFVTACLTAEWALRKRLGLA